MEKRLYGLHQSTYEPFRENLEDKLTTVDISETRELKDLSSS